MNSGGEEKVLAARLSHTLKGRSCDRKRRQRLVPSVHGLIRCCSALLALTVICCVAAKPSAAARHGQKSDVPEGFAIDLKASEADVLKAVELVTQDTVLHGTQVYSREDELTEAEAATGFILRTMDRARPCLLQDPQAGAFADTFQGQHRRWHHHRALHRAGVAPNRTHLQIDAVFIEDGAKRVHASDTTVETSEFAEIQSHIVRIQREEREKGRRRTCSSGTSCNAPRKQIQRNATRKQRV